MSNPVPANFRNRFACSYCNKSRSRETHSDPEHPGLCTVCIATAKRKGYDLVVGTDKARVVCANEDCRKERLVGLRYRSSKRFSEICKQCSDRQSYEEGKIPKRKTPEEKLETRRAKQRRYVEAMRKREEEELKKYGLEPAKKYKPDPGWRMCLGHCGLGIWSPDRRRFKLCPACRAHNEQQTDLTYRFALGVSRGRGPN